ncbi:MAG: asparagine synthase (glutamine-hydrolyzing) [Candidatus Omnitrophota bacterium]
MCGIAGYLLFSGVETTGATIRTLSAEIAHRGPDDDGMVLIDTRSPDKRFIDCRSTDPDLSQLRDGPNGFTHHFKHNLAMAHRRFSIIDLSDAGHQPMWNADRSLCVVTNGEIFNYTELKEELKSHGMRFRTQSDTEVMLAGYEVWGENAFSHFSGFWATAIYDFKKNMLLLSRDRIGKKPLYVYRNAERLVWASEIKALIRVLEPSQLRLNDTAMGHYLYHGRRDIGHQTFWTDIRMLDNAGVVIVSPDGRTEHKKYWTFPHTRRNETDISFHEAAGQFREVLQVALRERLTADVPVAFELSGGMDSSSLVALRAHMNRDEVPVFTVEYSDKRVDESAFARSVASHYPNIRHHVINFKEIDFWAHMNRFVYLMEEPYHNPNVLINHLLRKQMSDHGYRVIIAGAGGDEVLAGYKEYAAPIMKHLWAEGHYVPFLKNLVLYKENDPFRFKPMSRILMNRLFKQFGFLKPPQNRGVSTDIYIRSDHTPRVDPDIPKEINRLLAGNMADLRMYYWMSAGEKAAMGIPLETRSPFLDYRVVECVFSLPISYFMRNGWLKWLLRKAVGDLLPASVLWRKEKMGYPFPLERWLRENKTVTCGVFREFDNPWIDNRAIVRDYDLLVEQQPAFLWRALSTQLWLTRVVNRELIDFKKYQ